MPPPLSPLPPSPPCVRSSTARSQGAGGGPARGQTPLLTAVPPAGGPLCDDFLCLLTFFRRAATRPDRGAGIDIVVIELGFTSWTSLCGSFSAPRPFPPSSHHSPPPPHHRGTCRGVGGRPVWAGWLPLRERPPLLRLPPPFARPAGGGDRQGGGHRLTGRVRVRERGSAMGVGKAAVDVAPPRKNMEKRNRGGSPAPLPAPTHRPLRATPRDTSWPMPLGGHGRVAMGSLAGSSGPAAVGDTT